MAIDIKNNPTKIKRNTERERLLKYAIRPTPKMMINTWNRKMVTDVIYMPQK